MLKLDRYVEREFGTRTSEVFIAKIRQKIGSVSRAASMVVLLAASSASVAQIPYTEDFSTTTYLDGTPGQTTANWDTGAMQLLLPSSASLTGTTFSDVTTVEALSGSFITRSVALADLDGDGDLDLIDGTNGPVGVQLNDGSGNFGNRAYSSPRFSNTRSVAAADMDHDGDIDFVVGNNAGPIRLYLNDGSGTSLQYRKYLIPIHLQMTLLSLISMAMA